MTKRTKAKRKGPKPRPSWFLLDQFGNPGWRSLKPAEERREAQNRGNHYARYVPADPLARLKEDVVRAAAEWARCGAAAFPSGRTANALAAAVERLERKRR